MPSERRPLSQKVIDELYEEATLDLKYSNPQSPCQGNQADCASVVLGLIATVAALRKENAALRDSAVRLVRGARNDYVGTGSINWVAVLECDLDALAISATQGGDNGE